MLGCVSLHLLCLSCLETNLSDDDYAMLLFTGIAGYHQESLNLWFLLSCVQFSSILGLFAIQVLVSGPLGSFRQNLPFMVQVLSWNSHLLLSVTLTNLEDRTNFRSKLLWLVSPSLHQRNYLVTEDCQFSLHITHYSDFSLWSPSQIPRSFLALGFYLAPEMPPIPVIPLSILFLHSTYHLITPAAITTQHQSNDKIYFISHFREIHKFSIEAHLVTQTL